MTFRLLSDTLEEGQFLPLEQWAAYPGLDGGNCSPELHWEGAPEGTQSYVLTMFDPDAPTGSGWWHWVVVDLPASATQLPAGAGNLDATLPTPAYAVSNDSGTPAFGGAAAPVGHGEHRYIFTVHALKIPTLPLGEHPTPAQVGFHVHFNSLASATLSTRFGR